ncbi:ATP-binding cassette sub-family C member 5-like [Ptychodera flava]|uniref:ATP-binding cassette sub-family C member 5-like n=1 Tax=Ptychodera flava TaxID=63121 RepID=UPI003969D12D
MSINHDERSPIYSSRNRLIEADDNKEKRRKLTTQPIKDADFNKKQFSEEDFGLFSYLYLTWLTPLIKKAYRHGLKLSDLWVCTEADSAEYNARRLEELWKDEVHRKGIHRASLPLVFVKFTRRRCTIAIGCICFFSLGSFFNTMLLRKMIAYAQSSESNVRYGLRLAFGLALSELMKSIALNSSQLIQVRTGLQLRCAILTLIYNKVLKFRNLQGKTIGEIINVFTNDGDRLVDACIYVQFAFNGPFIMLLTVIYTTYVLGPAALCGNSLFFLTWASQAMFSRLLGSFRWKAVRITDTRIRMVSEMTNCIKLIKMYAWEEPFTKKIAGIRQKEKKILEYAGFVGSMNSASNAMIQGAAIVVTFVIHMALGNDLNAASAFAVVAMFALTRSALIAAPRAMKLLSEAYVAAKRMQVFLQTTEPQSHKLKPDDDHVAIDITKGTFAWDQNEQNGDKMEKPDDAADIRDVDNYSSTTSVNGLFNIDLTLNKVLFKYLFY